MARLTPEQLEQKLHAVLRDQPPRRAPLSLEARVLGEIARRQALPWWRKSYVHWPQSMRLVFLLVSVAAVTGGLLGSMHLAGLLSAQTFAPVVQPAIGAVATLRTAGHTLLDLVRPLAPSVSTTWLYAALAVIGAAYALLVGLGATAYRVLWHTHR